LNISKAGIQLIKDFAGFRESAYKDIGGVWTIGYGTTKGVKEGQKVTEEEAQNLLIKDLVQKYSAYITAGKD
jgi:lysozyme